MSDELQQQTAARAKNNQIKPISSSEDLEKEARDIVPPSELKIIELKNKNLLKSSEELKFNSNSPRGKMRGSKTQSPKKKPVTSATNSKRKNQRVSFNEQINKVHFVENWKNYNMENTVSKNGSHCCNIM